ncbi:MAG: DUF433 domain-containing protein [Bacteroidetes bacterium]|nr:DUF433 domain-containing protein [Bacteroidota bacterium]
MKNSISRITVNPDICNGRPVIRGMRISVKTVLEYLAAGETSEDILKAYPVLEKDDISACLRFAALISDKSIAGINMNT